MTFGSAQNKENRDLFISVEFLDQKMRKKSPNLYKI